MKVSFTVFPLLLISFAYGQSVDRIYIGLEEMWCSINKKGKKECYKDPEHPRHKWFRLSTITLTNDSAFLYQSPVGIYKKDTVFSVSDGGFYYYRGTYQETKDSIKINLKLDHCDYCPKPVEPKPDYGLKSLLAIRNRDGYVINGYLFKQSELDEHCP